jgi:beta-barrel assembly-enhancing protease
MRKLLLELIALLGIGGLIWAAFALFIKLPEKPSLVSHEKETEIGIKVREAVIRTNSFDLLYDSEIDGVLSEIAGRITTADSIDSEIRIELIKSEMVNAFALPGGFIIVTTGLVEFCESAEEFIGVICHEAGHVANRDVLNRLVSSLGLEILLSNDPFVTGEIARTLISSGYSRSQEKSADLYSCRLMEKLGLEPRALASFLRRIKEKEHWDDKYRFEYISSHPDLESRIREVLLYMPEEEFRQVQPWFDWAIFSVNVEKLKSGENNQENK